MLLYLSPLDLRRAVLAHLILARRPVSLGELVDALPADLGSLVDRKRVADMLRYQEGLGRVRRVRRGVYQYVPGSLAKATAWRCIHWRREHERVHGSGVERWSA